MKPRYILSPRTLVVLHDLGMVALAWGLAWWIRFNLEFPFPEWEICLFMMPLVVAIQGLVFWRYNLYRGLWRFASLPDLSNIIRATLLGTMSILLILFILFRLEGVPRSILVLYPLLLVVLLGGPRLGYRLWKDRALNLQNNPSRKQALIIGAGRAGEMLVREMLREGDLLPLGFLDDNPALIKTEIHGIRVLGPVSDIRFYAEKYSPDFIVIAVPSAGSEEMQRIVKLAETAGLPIRTLPTLKDLVSRGPLLKDLREVSIEDLLGRDKVELDWELIHKGISGRNVMITGGGGSIGSELCRQIIKLGPAQLIIFERSEFNLYRIMNELDSLDKTVPLAGVLGDVCDKNRVNQIFQRYHPQVVFHAAAYKHVPMLEQECREAVRNNVLGTVAIANAADKYAAEKFVLISTDKAVNPANVLGATKRLAEMYCEHKNSTSGGTRFITVRFGNVLGSDGSVVPLFQKQINDGGPVTVTHPEITRYFMTIHEACQLILQSAVMGKGGEIFVLDMGKPVKIRFLAEQMITLSGANSSGDVRIEITGLRPGEKLHEELFHADEEKIPTAHGKIILARHQLFGRPVIAERIQELVTACEQSDDGKIRDLLNSILPFEDYENRNSGKVIPITGM